MADYLTKTEENSLDRMIRSCLPTDLDFEDVEVIDNEEGVSFTYYFPMQELADSDYADSDFEFDIANCIAKKVKKHAFMFDVELEFQNCILDGMSNGDLDAFINGDTSVNDPSVTVYFNYKF